MNQPNVVARRDFEGGAFMSAKQLLDEGKLSAALEALTAEVRAQPSDLARRTFLFELLCFAGELERAGRQLEAIAHLDSDPKAMVGLQVYRTLLEGESRRARLFSEGLRPRFLLEPPAEVSLHLEAIEQLRLGNANEARARLDRAAEQRSSRHGQVGETRFDDFRDADDLLAPVLEVYAPAGYSWVPWEQIQYLEVPPPRSLRDLLWAPARLASFDGQLGEVYLPALYPGSHTHPDEAARLGRLTDWQDAGAGIIRGAGLKTFLVGDDARTLFQLGNIQFDAPTGVPESSD